MEILILAGGGGHTGYAFALAQALDGNASLSFLVPEGDVLSESKLRRFGTVEYLLKPRGPKTPFLRFLPRLIRAGFQSLRKVSGRYDVVVSTGSNFCLPPALAAWVRGIPVVSIESSVRFTKASKTASVLRCFSKITALQWEDQLALLPGGEVVGPILPKPEVASWDGGYVLVTGGTYGHRALFDAASEAELEDVVLQTGEVEPEPYACAHPGWKVLRRTEEFGSLLAGARVVVTHFGLTALEAAVYRKPTVIVLNPEWKRTVGLEDARVLAERLNAVLLPDVSSRALSAAIEEAKGKPRPELLDGARNLAKRIVELARKEPKG